MKRFMVLIFALSTLCAVSAQNRFAVRGRAVDAASREPVGYATAVLRRDSTVVSALAADAGGAFELTCPGKGRYRLEVTMVGYNPAVSEVEVAGPATELGDVELKQGVEIADVVVSVQKPLVVNDAEKLTYSVEDDPQASTSTLDEIIRKVPQLSLDAEGNVLLNGQSNYKILMNGRPSASLNNNFKEAIKGIPASSIRKIEVITHPSTKYEAEGVGGIINLITDRSKQFTGYNGNVSAGAAGMGMPAHFGNASTTVQTGKLAASVMGYYSRYRTNSRTTSVQESWRENVGAENRYQLGSSEIGFDGQHYGVNLDLSYTIDTLNFITLNGSFWGGNNDSRSASLTDIYDPQMQPAGGFGDIGDTGWSYSGGTVGLNYEHTFRRTGHTLTVSDEVDIDPEHDDTRTTVTDLQGLPLSLSDRRSRTHSYGNTVQIDYANPLNEHHNIEAGLKHIYRYSDARADLATLLPDGTAADDPQRDDMIYRQHILGIYAGYGFTFSKWSGRLGTRMESTWNDADVEEPGHEPYAIRKNLFNVVPYLSLSFRPTEGHSLSMSYTERLQRPGISMLSPAVDDTQPTRLSYGNPDLEAAVFHSLNLQYGYFSPKWSAMFGLTGLISNNSMTEYTFTDPATGIAHSTYSNDVHTRSCGFNGSFSVRPSQMLNLSISYNGQYAVYDFAPMDIHTDRFSFSGGVNLDCALWKEARLMLGGYYNTGDVSLGSYNKGYYYYYAGLKQSLFKKRLDLSVSVSNPFEKETTFRQEYVTPTYVARSLYRNRSSRRMMVNLSWRFGKQNVTVKRASRTISNDDMQSGNKGGGSGMTGMGQ